MGEYLVALNCYDLTTSSSLDDLQGWVASTKNWTLETSKMFIAKVTNGVIQVHGGLFGGGGCVCVGGCVLASVFAISAESDTTRRGPR